MGNFYKQAMQNLRACRKKTQTAVEEDSQI